jgi:hypothetical protein
MVRDFPPSIRTNSALKILGEASLVSISFPIHESLIIPSLNGVGYVKLR